MYVLKSLKIDGPSFHTAPKRDSIWIDVQYCLGFVRKSLDAVPVFPKKPPVLRWHLSVRMPSPYTPSSYSPSSYTWYSHPLQYSIPLGHSRCHFSPKISYSKTSPISIHNRPLSHTSPTILPPPFPHPPPHTLKPGVGNKYWSVYVCTYSWCACAWGFLGGRGGAIWATHGELPHPPPRVLVPRELLLG